MIEAGHGRYTELYTPVYRACFQISRALWPKAMGGISCKKNPLGASQWLPHLILHCQARSCGRHRCGVCERGIHGTLLRWLQPRHVEAPYTVARGEDPDVPMLRLHKHVILAMAPLQLVHVPWDR